MPHASWMAADLSPGGDRRTVVPRREHNPVSFPELSVLRFIHGEQGVANARPIKVFETDPVVEKSRLLEIYGGVVEQIFPGVNPQMVMLAPGHEAAPVASPPHPSAYTPPEDLTPFGATEPEAPAPKRRGRPPKNP